MGRDLQLNVRNKTASVSNTGARRVLVVGVTGTGKTYLAKQLASKVQRLLVVDPLCEWGDVTVMCFDWQTVLEEVSQERFRVSICVDENPRDVLEFASRIVRDEDVGNCLLVVDELSLFFRRGEEASDGIQGVVRFGRRENINLMLLSQRSYDCPIDLRSQLSDIFAFRSHEPRDIQALGQMVGRDQAQQVLALRGHQHYHWDLTHESSTIEATRGGSDIEEERELANDAETYDTDDGGDHVGDD
jgi:hypothetical protein